MWDTRKREATTASIEHEQKLKPDNEKFKMICH